MGHFLKSPHLDGSKRKCSSSTLIARRRGSVWACGSEPGDPDVNIARPSLTKWEEVKDEEDLLHLCPWNDRS